MKKSLMRRIGRPPLQRIHTGDRWRRCSLLVLLICSLQLQIFAQQPVLTLKVDHAPAEKVFELITKQTGYNFIYTKEHVRQIRPISFYVQNKTLIDVLNLIFAQQDLTYTISDKDIILQQKKGTGRDTPKATKKDQATLYGVVMDKTRMPLKGVTVAIDDDGKHVVTNEKGEFSILVSHGAKVAFSYVGFDREEVVFMGNNDIKIVLSPSENRIQDVIVTGIFDRPKESFTGAVTTVTAAELKRFAPQNPLMALQLLDPAFQLPPNLEAGGNPNVMPEIRLRGQNNFPVQQGRTNSTLNALYGNNPNSPLFIMDGFEIPLQTLVDMDMNRIASISILKDASATAIYGSRGSNGVVVIETIRPKPGAIQIGYTGNVGLAIPDLSSYNLMNAKEKYALEKLAGLHDVTGRYSASVDYDLRNLTILDNIYKEVARGVDTYWLSQPLRTAVSQSHTLNFMGGDQAFRYSMTGSYKTTPGVMIGNDRNSFNGSLNLQYVTGKLTIGNNLQYYNVKATESPFGSFAQYTQLNPFLTPYDANGNFVQFLGDFQNNWGDERNNRFGRSPSLYRKENPLYAANLNPENYTTDSRLINNLQLRWNLASNFFVQGRFSYTLANGESHNFQPSGMPRFADLPFSERGRYDLDLTKTDMWDADLQANYSKHIKKHIFYASLSGYLKSTESQGYFQSATGFANENMRNFIFANQYSPGSRPSGSQATLRQVTLRGNVNYSYNNRYLLDFSYSSDGSSQFGANRRYNTFWSLGARWNVHEESFLHNNPVINRLQIRGSLGPTGGQNFPPYQGITTYQYTVGKPYRDILSASLANFGDPNLQWQNTFKQNIGFDLTLFRDRVNVTADLFKDKVTNVLMEINRPPSVGFSSYSTNLGELENTGWELKTNIALIRNLQRDINWTFSFNTMQLRNKITSMASIPGVTVPVNSRGEAMPENRIQELQTRNNFRYVVGGSMDDIWAIPSAGIDPATGWEIFVMPNGEYTYAASTLFERPLGNVQPKFLGSMATSFQYKNWVFSAAASYRTGARIFNVNLRDRIEFPDNLPLYWNVDRRVMTDRWINPGDEKPFLGLTSRPVYRTSSRFLQTERMLQMQSISLAYRFPKDLGWLKRARMSNTMLSLYWNTPFTITSMESEQRGLTAPFQRNFSIQLSTTFF